MDAAGIPDAELREALAIARSNIDAAKLTGDPSLLSTAFSNLAATALRSLAELQMRKGEGSDPLVALCALSILDAGALLDVMETIEERKLATAGSVIGDYMDRVRRCACAYAGDRPAQGFDYTLDEPLPHLLRAADLFIREVGQDPAATLATAAAADELARDALQLATGFGIHARSERLIIDAWAAMAMLNYDGEAAYFEAIHPVATAQLADRLGEAVDAVKIALELPYLFRRGDPDGLRDDFSFYDL